MTPTTPTIPSAARRERRPAPPAALDAAEPGERNLLRAALLARTLSDLLLANVCKQNVTRFPYEIVRLAEDIAGGLMVTAPSEADLRDETLGPYVEKYLKGVASVTTENRLRILHSAVVEIRADLLREEIEQELGIETADLLAELFGKIQLDLADDGRLFGLGKFDAFVRHHHFLGR